MKYGTIEHYRADSKQIQMLNGKQRINLEWPKAIVKFIIIYLICHDRVAPKDRACSYKGAFQDTKAKQLNINNIAI